MKPKTTMPRYWLARGKSLKILEGLMARRKEAIEASEKRRRKLRRMFGAEECWLYADGAVAGFAFKEDPPSYSWKRVDKSGRTFQDRKGRYRHAWLPKLSNKEGKGHYARMREKCPHVHIPTANDLAEELGWGDFVYTSQAGQLCVGGTHAEKIGEEFVIIVQRSNDKEDKKRIPPDAERLKPSQYWLMKEEAGLVDVGAEGDQ